MYYILNNYYKIENNIQKMKITNIFYKKNNKKQYNIHNTIKKITTYIIKDFKT